MNEGKYISQKDKKPAQAKFLSFDPKTNWLWFQEEISYLFVPASQITEIKLVSATDGSINVYIRLDLRDRFEYKLINNTKTLTSAKKLAEDFITMIQNGKLPEKKKKQEPETNSNSDGLSALTVLMEDLKK